MELSQDAVYVVNSRNPNSPESKAFRDYVKPKLWSNVVEITKNEIFELIKSISRNNFILPKWIIVITDDLNSENWSDDFEDIMWEMMNELHPTIFCENSVFENRVLFIVKDFESFDSIVYDLWSDIWWNLIREYYQASNFLTLDDGVDSESRRVDQFKWLKI